MRLCFIADARSPIAKQWIQYFVGQGHDVFVISSYPCEPGVLPGAEVATEPLLFADLLHGGPGKAGTIPEYSASSGRFKKVEQGARYLLAKKGVADAALAIRDAIGPLELRRHKSQVRTLIRQFQPDLVHGMRIPFEGMIASMSIPTDVPLVISVWGNDFTLHGRKNGIIRRHTEATMRRANALLADCKRDVRLALDWGFRPGFPTAVLPGSGGVRSEHFFHAPPSTPIRTRYGIPPNSPMVINPRGLRKYVRNDTFFQSIPLILSRHPTVHFLCTGTQGNAQVEHWVDQLDIKGNVRLLPTVPHNDMGELFRASMIMVSPSEHDGTPNTLLEAMACGSFPVTGDIESVREWIRPEINGLLFDPSNPAEIADAVVRALERPDLRASAQKTNADLIRERAEYRQVMAQAEAFYRVLIQDVR